MKRNIIRKNTGLNGISIERQIEIPDYDMTLLKLSTMTPYLEGRRVHKTLDHNKKENEDSRLVVKYNVEDASNPTPLYFYHVAQEEGEPSALGVNMFDKVEIDGTEVSITDIDSASGAYQLSSGEHTVAYTLKDPTIISPVLDESTGTFKVGAVFMECISITSVTIPDSVTSIGASAFASCSGLTTIDIPNSVTSIGSRAFDGTPWWNTYSVDTASQYGSIIYINDVAYKAVSTTITRCEFKEGTISISSSAFSGCSSLTSVTIPSSVTSIGWGAFCGCPLDSASATAIRAINTNATKCPMA